MLRIEKWDYFELDITGQCTGNPFVDASLTGTFEGKNECVTVDGFYDGNNHYKIRFMPSFEGIYSYRIEGNIIDEPLIGEFQAEAPKCKANHGRVQVVDQYHLGYEDGTPYYSIGTTCYAWVYQPEELQEKTLETLKNSPFNKIRFCIYPKFYLYNEKEPIAYPYERGNGEGLNRELAEKEERERLCFPGILVPEMDYNFNYYRPNVEQFQRFDLRIKQLRDMGIEADLILMHPYDRWGMNVMNAECCDLYIRYVTARYGAFRNVWWSLANEYDLIAVKTIDDWERYASIICEKDVYQHLRSVHNCGKYYDYSKPWVTHCSAQRTKLNVEDTNDFMEKYKKPVVWDEICYEGNIELGWGNITGQELVRRFWEATLRGGHAGHGETFLDEERILWWSHGGILKGESAPRLQFLLDICKEVPGRYIKNGKGIFDEVVGVSSECEIPKGDAWEMKYTDYEIHYYGIGQPSFRMLYLPEDKKYQIDVIDTWNMTITPLGVHSGETKVDLPGNQYMAIRLRRGK